MKWKISARMWPAVLLLSLSVVCPAGARIITVDDDAPADFNNIQAAINDANDGDTVEIEPGTYTGGGNYNIRFNGKAITVRGTNPEDFEVIAETVIDCNSQGRGFIFESGEDSNSVLSGLTVTKAHYDGSYNHFGGAIGCYNSSPVISKCIIEDNYGDLGGGIGAKYGQLAIRDCIIRRNQAGQGGAIFISSADTLTIEDCLIIANTGSSEGGAVRSSAALQTIKNCLFVGNRTDLHGGAIACKRGDVLIADCTITGNAAGTLGGGIRSLTYGYSTTIVNSVVYDNYAPTGPEIAFDYVWTSSKMALSWCDLRGGQSDIFLDPNYTLDWGPGNIDVDPCFADPGYWGHVGDPNVYVEPNDPNATWVDGGGDYHLKSQGGRWDAHEGEWTIDEVTSLCIDAGDPNFPLGPEPFPNGGRRNIGAYGGTVEASKSYFDKPPCETIVAGDINGDCIVDGRDFALLARNWLISDLQPPSPWRPGRATNPYPADGAIDPPPPGPREPFILSWQAGHRAETHDVYFGTVSPGDFQGNQTETEFHPGIVFTSGTYYWRIDEINPYGKTTGAVWSFSFSPPAPATDPIPADGATGVCAGRLGTFTLDWTAGARAKSHDIYFGTVSPGEFQGNQTTSDTHFSLGPALLRNTYYWRIDEVSGPVKTIGPVWTFTVQGPPAATNPYPADGAEPTSAPLILSWQPGASNHDVYFGTESPGDFRGNQAGTTFDPGALEPQRTYYWRIDEISGCGKTTGPVWTFKTSLPDPPSDPYPADGATYTSTLVTLAWQAGAGAETHDVYFGTEAPGQFQGNQAGTTFTKSGLQALRTYYWRIDEVNAYGKTTGPVWQFMCSPAR